MYCFPRLLRRFLPRDFALSLGLSKWLKDHVVEYDIVNIHGFFNYPVSVAARHAHRAGVPYVLRTCGMLDPGCLAKRRLGKTAFLKLYGDRMLSRAAAISSTSEQEAEVSYKKHGPARRVVIPLGVPEADRVHEEGPALPLPDGKKIVLYLSRLDPIKGLDLLLPAVSHLKQKRSDFFLVIAGGGDAKYEGRIRSEVRRLGLSDDVLLAGPVEGWRKWKLLEEADCFILPSYHENFGVSALEAMAAGCPVVVSNRVGIHAEIAAARAGAVVKCDVRDIASGLDKLLSNEAERRAFGTNGKELALNKYNWDRIGKAVFELYQSCLGRRD